jgi:hypothetical protein
MILQLETGSYACPPGPWDGEPDRWEDRAAGLPVLAIRHPRAGNWCGYAAVPPAITLGWVGGRLVRTSDA